MLILRTITRSMGSIKGLQELLLPTFRIAVVEVKAVLVLANKSEVRERTDTQNLSSNVSVTVPRLAHLFLSYSFEVIVKCRKRILSCRFTSEFIRML